MRITFQIKTDVELKEILLSVADFMQVIGGLRFEYF